MAPAGANRAASLRGRLAYYFPTIAVAVGVIMAWELLVLAFDIQQFLLPKPSAIFGEFMRQVNLWLAPGERSILFESSGATFWEAFGGFIIGCGGGVLVALITSRWTIVSEATMPFAIAANSVPIIAFAPIMNNWFGITNPASKMAIVAIIVFFPTMINTVRGLTLVDARPVGADALLRGGAQGDSAQAAHTERAALYVQRLSRGQRAELDRRGRGRVLRRAARHAGRLHHAGGLGL